MREESSHREEPCTAQKMFKVKNFFNFPLNRLCHGEVVNCYLTSPEGFGHRSTTVKEMRYGGSERTFGRTGRDEGGGWRGSLVTFTGHCERLLAIIKWG